MNHFQKIAADPLSEEKKILTELFQERRLENSHRITLENYPGSADLLVKTPKRRKLSG